MARGPQLWQTGMDFHRVDIDMRRHAGHPVDDLGDIHRTNRFGPLIDRIGLVLVAVKADHGELALGQSGLDIGDPYLGVVEVGEQVAGKLLDKGLGGPIDIAAGIRIVAGDRAHVDDVALVALHHPGKDTSGEVTQPLDVGVDHGFPVLNVGLVGAFQPQRQAGIVDQDIDLFELLGQPRDHGLDGFIVAHIQLDRQHRNRTELLLQGPQPVTPASGEDQTPPFGGKTFGTGLAESGGGSGNTNSSLHTSLLI